MDCIDLRSDTVTWPTDEMREAMANAKVGDAVWGDDPTVLELQGLAAEMTGKEAAVFVPSGTMANLAAMLSHCSRGDEVILGDRSHVFRFEGGGISALGSLHPHIVPNQDDGTLNLEDVEAAIRPPGNDHFPTSRAVVV
ncbi:MAG: beta-eliminating lyase-related protein, partial [Chloroflexota bacterium]